MVGLKACGLQDTVVVFVICSMEDSDWRLHLWEEVDFGSISLFFAIKFQSGGLQHDSGLSSF